MHKLVNAYKQEETINSKALANKLQKEKNRTIRHYHNQLIRDSDIVIDMIKITLLKKSQPTLSKT